MTLVAQGIYPPLAVAVGVHGPLSVPGPDDVGQSGGRCAGPGERPNGVGAERQREAGDGDIVGSGEEQRQ